jgi:hypothetical protein
VELVEPGIPGPRVTVHTPLEKPPEVPLLVSTKWKLDNVTPGRTRGSAKDNVKGDNVSVLLVPLPIALIARLKVSDATLLGVVKFSTRL